MNRLSFFVAADKLMESAGGRLEFRNKTLINKHLNVFIYYNFFNKFLGLLGVCMCIYRECLSFFVTADKPTLDLFFIYFDCLQFSNKFDIFGFI